MEIMFWSEVLGDTNLRTMQYGRKSQRTTKKGGPISEGLPERVSG
jgi:hypothetical protein